MDVREKSGYAKMKWKVGAETGRKVEVCDKAFRNCYKVGHDYVETIVKALKAGAKVAAKDFNDRTAGYSDDIAVRIVKEAAARGYVSVYVVINYWLCLFSNIFSGTFPRGYSNDKDSKFL